MRNLIYLFTFVFFTTQAQTKMTSVEANQLKAKVKSASASTKTMTSNFIQYKHLDFLENDIETSGKLAFKSPNLVKWEYTKPFKYSILFKGDMLYINNEGNKSDIDIGSSKLFKQLNKLIISSINGDMFNDTEFDIQYFIDKDKNSLVYFNPKDEKLSKYIKTFHITFNEKGDVIKVKMMEPSLDYTKIVFTNKIKNQRIDEAVFTH